MPKEWDGSWTPRFIATRNIVDDFGEIVERRRCSKCHDWLSLSSENFTIKQRGRDASIVQWDWQCLPCRRESSKAYRARMDREQASALYRQKYLRETATQEARERRKKRQREAQRRYRERHPERARESRKRSAAKLKADPIRYAQRLADSRMYHYLRKERQGQPLPEVEATINASGTEIPVGPFVIAIEHYLQRVNWWGGDEADELNALERIGINPRSLYDWRRGRRKAVRFDVVDRALTNMSLNWWDIYEKPTNGHADDPEAWKAYRIACVAFEGELVE